MPLLLSLPAELLDAVCARVDTASAVALARTCATLHPVAERALYSTLDLTHPSAAAREATAIFPAGFAGVAALPGHGGVANAPLVGPRYLAALVHALQARPARARAVCTVRLRLTLFDVPAAAQLLVLVDPVELELASRWTNAADLWPLRRAVVAHAPLHEAWWPVVVPLLQVAHTATLHTIDGGGGDHVGPPPAVVVGRTRLRHIDAAVVSDWDARAVQALAASSDAVRARISWPCGTTFVAGATLDALHDCRVTVPAQDSDGTLVPE